MGETKSIVIKGHCDHLGRTHAIDAKYTKFQALCMDYPVAKFATAVCEYSNECGIYESCPLIRIAEKKTEW